MNIKSVYFIFKAALKYKNTFENIVLRRDLSTRNEVCLVKKSF